MHITLSSPLEIFALAAAVVLLIFLLWATAIYAGILPPVFVDFIKSIFKRKR